MRIADLMGQESIVASLRAKSKREVLEELAKAALKGQEGLEGELDDVTRVLLAREQLGSTGIGDGTAIPHGKIPGVDTMRIAFGRSREGIDFNALDGRPVYLFFFSWRQRHHKASICGYWHGSHG